MFDWLFGKRKKKRVGFICPSNCSDRIVAMVETSVIGIYKTEAEAIAALDRWNVCVRLSDLLEEKKEGEWLIKLQSDIVDVSLAFCQEDRNAYDEKVKQLRAKVRDWYKGEA